MSGLATLGAERERPLAPLTSLKVGGVADWFLLARDWEAAACGLRVARQEGLPVLVVGGGSNVLAADAGVEGLVLKPAWGGFELREAGAGRAVLTAGAAQPFSGLARRLARLGWGGLEWAVSVPGSVGGAVVNNAGAFGGEVADRLLGAEVVDAGGRRSWLEAAELAYRYRESRLKLGTFGPLVVVAARFALERAEPALLVRRVREFQEQRTRAQPRQSSAGSVFANPPGDFAGRLIEAAGLKGTEIGRARISPQHANFIVNLGGATADDVYALLTLAQSRVWRRLGIWLRPEVQLVGRWSTEQRRRIDAPAT